MSSSRPPSRRLAGWSLRARLLAGMMVLLAVVCIALGLFSELLFRERLIAQLDTQLNQVANVTTRLVLGPGPGDEGGGGPPPGSRPQDLRRGPANCQSGVNAGLATLPFPAASAGALNVLVANGSVLEAAQLTADNCQQPLSTTDAQTLVPVPMVGRPYTQQVGGLGSFRMLALTDQSGRDLTVITGLPMQPVTDTLVSLGVILGSLAVIALVVAGFAGAVIVRKTLRPLRRVADTASRVAELELDRGDVALSVRVPAQDTDPRTEVGQVGAALNRMLGHIGNALAVRHASETRVRQFVADASHELRTPLAAIRGYAELARRSHLEVPREIAHALRRVESESARMTTLVDDLLLLARLDSGRPLQAAPVDLSRLVVDAVSDAHIAGPQHSWRLDLPADPVQVTGDEQRLHQVLANLLSNARTHTPPGSTVTTGLAARNGTVTVTVADDGPGIPEDLLPAVFERFARGDTSRSRNAGSTGLGLAIVNAVVAAHHGTVEVTSRPGRTMFTVTLPQ